MRLKRVTEADPIIRRSLGIHKSVDDQVSAYQAMYAQRYSEDISYNLLIEEMVKSFMANDPGFKKFLRTYVAPESRANDNDGGTEGDSRPHAGPVAQQ